MSCSRMRCCAASLRWYRRALRRWRRFGDLADFFFRDDVMPEAELFVPKKRSLEETMVFTAELLAALEGCEWSSEALDATMRAVGTAKEWSVKENFMLLRAILTGKTTSPPLLESLVVFGKARSLDRVRRFVDFQKKQRRVGRLTSFDCYLAVKRMSTGRDLGGNRRRCRRPGSGGFP